MKEIEKNQNDKQSSKSKTFNKLFTIIFCNVLLFSACASVLTYYLVTSPSKATKVELTKVSGPEILANKGDTIIFHSKVKNSKGLTIWDEPTQIPGVSYEYQNGSNVMIVKAISNLSSPKKINLKVTNNNVSDSCTISIKNVEYNKIPVTSDYFTFDTTDDIDDTIRGFSPAVEADPSILTTNGYTSLDLSSSSVKYVAGDAHFDRSVFEAWDMLKMSFSGLIFQFALYNGNNYGSGSGLFRSCNFSSCIELDFSNTDFASYIDAQFPTHAFSVATAYQTFMDAKFNNLYSINFKNAIFASPTTNTNTLPSLSTGSLTFANAKFPNAALLDLSDAIFATGNMGVCTKITTGEYMFGYADFSSLQVLNTTNTVFAHENMLNLGIGQLSNQILTAERTFALINFSNELKTLDLSKTIFSAPNMSMDGNVKDISTAFFTFYESNIQKLISLNLENIEFAHESNASIEYHSAYNTFSYIDMSNLKSLNLNNTVFAAENMSHTSPTGLPVYTADSTFFSSNLSGLTNLDLSTCTFATQNMNDGGVYSAYKTFSDTFFSSLEKLDLSNIEFATENMCNDGEVRSACETFAGSNLSDITTLDLSNTKFSSSNMYKINSTPQNLLFYSAYSTFSSANLSILKTLSFSNTEFASNTMTDAAVNSDAKFHIFYSTFEKSLMEDVKILDLSHASIYSPDLPSASTYSIGANGFSESILSTCSNIFLYKEGKYQETLFKQPSSGDFLFPTTGTIHWEDYDTSTNLTPNGWNSSMSRYPFDSWTWTNDMTGGAA
ncbi:MAG: hypothetical protein Ta2E_07400 [Mycoplasmoidaceae bacterium]|nr:MAG: hypothetical protein Ta2E_07400 [Mycoplasmoidaceae bacterium]